MNTHIRDAERRVAPRVSFVTQALARAAGRQVQCTTVNLSSSGMLVLPSASARAGLELDVVFEVKNFVGVVTLNALLAREAEYRGQYGWGIQFVDTPQKMATLLQLYVNKRLMADQPMTVATPPMGMGPEGTSRSGEYMQTRRRSTTSWSSSSNSGASRGAASTISSEHYRASTGAYRRSQASVSSAAESAARRSAIPTPPAGEQSTERRPSSHQAPNRNAASSRAVAPPLAGMGAPGADRRKAIAERLRADAGGQSASAARLSQTGPPRRGASSRMHNTGPQRAQSRVLRQRDSDWSRKSHLTPVEIRDLYRAALDEVSGPTKKKR